MSARKRFRFTLELQSANLKGAEPLRGPIFFPAMRQELFGVELGALPLAEQVLASVVKELAATRWGGG